MSRAKKRAGQSAGASPRQRFTTAVGVPVLLERDHSLPVVDLELVVRAGSLTDPEGRQGLTAVLARTLRRGTRALRGPDVEEAIAALGARLSLETSRGLVRIHGTVIRRNLEPFVELLAGLLRAPAFRGADIDQVRREAIADLVSRRDDDASLVSRGFRQHLFGDHPYARPIIGTPTTLRRLRRRDLVERWQAIFRRGSLVFGAAGDVSADELARLLDANFSFIDAGRAARPRVPATKLPRGRHVLVIDKPARTQTQLLVGTLGTKRTDPHKWPLLLANAAFGGTFTSRLTQEVRAKRGYSYGASSRLGINTQRDAWSMWSFPSAEHTMACLELELAMLESWVDKGPTRAELRLAKSYIQNGLCFDQDTAAKRLASRLEHELLGEVADSRRYPAWIRGVTLERARDAVRARISARDLTIAVVATASEVVPDLEALPGVRSVEVVRFDAL